MWEEQLINELSTQAKDYPTKALLEVLLELSQQQCDRLELLQDEIDGKMWSPAEW
ncbi:MULTISPECIES: hypothetical protein [unclassified Facklamia]|uniref:hypothetical protein n=1 Tax=Aerococcaceae TaxID=186827 RepID=UPI001935FD8C|nr:MULTISPECIES: hypothetical protein [unclassified Facklamia]QQD65333.1 hypothetical protein JDW14_08555 [Aerococcaceae bacterium zg-252]